MGFGTNEYHLVMARSLITKYLLIALGAGVILCLVLAGLSYYEHRVDTADINQLTHTAVEQKLEADLEARADSLSKITGALLAPALAAGNKTAVTSIAERLLEERDIERVEVADAHGVVLFTGSNAADDSAGRGPFVLKRSVRGKTTRVTQSDLPEVGTLQIWLNRGKMQDTLVSIQSQMENRQGHQVKRMSSLLAEVVLPLILLGLIGAWYIARQLSRPISALVKSADRIGEGDYTRPLAVVRRDELGELQFALERMRQNLAETTITKNYLNTVLNSLSDAVLVTSPDGIVKSCNEATLRLLGYQESDLVGKPLISFIDDEHRTAFDPTNSATEARETVLRTASGQTIPVSMANSTITSEDPQFQGNIYVARNITERKRAERRIRYLARYDTLTKMPNRMQFQHLLQQAIARSHRNQRSLALLYLDLDRFKEVNDTFGHAAGDRTLEILSERLTRSLSKDTVIGRLAGDEFAMFIDDLPPDCDNRPALATLARTLLDEISRTFYVNQQEVYLTASVGVAICPFDADNVIDLIRNADAAMYHSKQNGGNSSAFYVPEMNAAAVQATSRPGARRVGDSVPAQGGSTRRPGGRSRSLAALAAAGTRGYLAVAIHSPGRGNQPHPGHRRMGHESRVPGLPRVAEDRAAARTDCHQSVAAPIETDKLHRPLPQRVPPQRGIAHLLRTRSDRNHVDDRSEAHHRPVERSLRHGPASRHRRLRHRLLVAVRPAAISHRHLENRSILRARCGGRLG